MHLLHFHQQLLSLSINTCRCAEEILTNTLSAIKLPDIESFGNPLRN